MGQYNTGGGGGGGGATAWGAITGTLSNQADLQSALNGKVSALNAALTGTPTAPTATVGTNTTQIATTAFVLANASSLSGLTVGYIPVANSASSITNSALRDSGTQIAYGVTAATNTLFTLKGLSTGAAVTPGAATNAYSLQGFQSDGTTQSYFISDRGEISAKDSYWLNGAKFIHYGPTYASNNFFAGKSAGNATLTGNANIGVGGVLMGVTSGVSNVCFSDSAGNAITTGSYNTLFGSSTGGTVSTANGNTLLGYQVLISNNTNYNTAVGYRAAVNVSGTGISNLYLGENTGSALVSGDYNIMIGSYSGQAAAGSFSYSAAIGPLSDFTKSNQLVLGSSSGVSGFYEILLGQSNRQGSYNRAPSTFLITTGSNFNTTSNTDLAGSSMRYSAGQSFGAGAPGNFIIAVGATGTTGTTLNTTYVDAITVSGGNARIGFGVSAPTATTHYKAGVATASGSPLKFTSGVNLTTVEAGAVEWDGTSLFITQTTGPTRKQIAYTTDITTVTGTTNRVTVTSGVVDISAAYVGQNTITTLGTVTTGTWNGVAIADAYISSAATWNAKLSNVIINTSGPLHSSPVSSSTASGVETLTMALLTQTANMVFAGPTTGIAATPTFRTLVSADLPVITSLGTVTTGTWNATPIADAYISSAATWNAKLSSVVINSASVIFTSPVSNSIAAGVQTFTMSLATQTANAVFAGPASGGVLAPSFRTLVAADLPGGVLSGLTAGYVPVATSGTTLGNSAMKDSGTQLSYGMAPSASVAFTLKSNGTNNTTYAQRVFQSNSSVLIYSLDDSGGASFLGNLGIAGTATTTAKIHIQAAGTATANTAPIQLTNGTRETTARSGLIEFENNWYHTNSSLLRYALVGVIADFFTDVATTTATTETDLYTYTTPANSLNVNGDKIVAEYAVQIKATGGTTKQIRGYFAGALVFDTAAMSVSTATDMNIVITVIRDSATTVRVTARSGATGTSAAQLTKITKLTGLTLSATNIVKITATVGTGAVAGDVTAISGFVQTKGAA